MPAFADLVTYFLDELFTLQPDIATAVGDHRYDDQWPDTSEAGRQGRLAFADRWRKAFGDLDPAALSRDDRIDRDLILGELDAAVFGEVTLREDAWDPMLWIYLVGSGLHPLLAREFAPLAQRLASVTGRLEGIPTIVADARATIGSVPERPVSRLHAEIAGKRIGGVADLGRQAVETAEAAAPTDAAVAVLLPRLRAASDAAAEALDELGRYLVDEVAPAPRAARRLATPCSPSKLRHTMRDPEITPRRSSHVPRRSSRPSGGDGEDRARRVAGVARRPPDPDDDGALVLGCLTRSRPTTLRPVISWRTAARSSWGSRRSAASGA